MMGGEDRRAWRRLGLMIGIYVIWLTGLGVLVWLASVPPRPADRTAAEMPGAMEPGQPQPTPAEP